MTYNDKTMSQHNEINLSEITGLKNRNTLFYQIKGTKQFQTTLKILYLISNSEKAYQYDLPKKVGLSYRTVLRHLELLKDFDFIELDHTEKSSKKGIEKNVWKITFSGVLTLLNDIFVKFRTPFEVIQAAKKEPRIKNITKNPYWKKYQEENKKLKTLAINNPDFLPLVFGKWGFFENQGIITNVIWRLSFITQTYSHVMASIFSTKDYEDYKKSPNENFGTNYNELMNNLYEISGDSQIVQNKIKNQLTRLVFGLMGLAFGDVGPVLKQDTAENYLSSLCKDAEIRDYIRNQVENRRKVMEKGYRAQLKELEWFSEMCK